MQTQLVDCGFADIETESPYVYGVESAKDLFHAMIGRLSLEAVGLLCMDSAHRIVNYSVIGLGQANKVVPSVSQVMRTALLSNASYIMIAHNHPSGICEITEPDIEMTKRIGSAARIMDIVLIDSLVVCPSGECVSIRERIGVKHEP